MLEERQNKIVVISSLVNISIGSKCSLNIQRRKQVEKKERKKTKKEGKENVSQLAIKTSAGI